MRTAAPVPTGAAAAAAPVAEAPARVAAPAAVAAAAPAAAAPVAPAPGAPAPGAAAQAAPTAVETAAQRGVDRLFVFQGIPSAAAQPGQNLEFNVPREAFGHTNQKAIVQLDAMRTNGAPLPEWLDFDPVSGKFSGKPPRGGEAVLEIKVVARDNEGREVATTFTIRVGGDNAQAPQQGRPAQTTDAGAPLGERVIVADAGDAEEAEEKAKEARNAAKDGKEDAPKREKVRIASLPFSEQLNRARQDPLLARIMEAKEQAAAKAQPPVRQA